MSCISGAATPGRTLLGIAVSCSVWWGKGFLPAPPKYTPAARTGQAAPNCAEPFASNPRYCSWGDSAPRGEGPPPVTCASRAVFLDSLCARVFFSPQVRLAGPQTPGLTLRASCAELRRARGNKEPDSRAWCDATPSVCCLTSCFAENTHRAPLPFPLAPRHRVLASGQRRHDGTTARRSVNNFLQATSFQQHAHRDHQPQEQKACA